jgi:class I fructose-bisphosphate aldolase
MSLQSWSQAGKSIRLGQILNPETRKAVIVAMDHGITRLREGIEVFDMAIKKIMQGEPDAIMINAGIVKRYFTYFVGKNAPGLIVRVDGRRKPLVSVKNALACGASAIITWLTLGLGEDAERYNLNYLSKYLQDCEKYGVPLIVETMVFEKGPNGEFIEKQDTESIKNACRIASEIGCDLIKAPYVENMEEVVRCSSVPILVLGGKKMKTELDVLKIVKRAIDAGCIGCIIGRNIWQHSDPAGMIKALKKVIHEKVDPEIALKVIKF